MSLSVSDDSISNVYTLLTHSTPPRNTPRNTLRGMLSTGKVQADLQHISPPSTPAARLAAPHPQGRPREQNKQARRHDCGLLTPLTLCHVAQTASHLTTHSPIRVTHLPSKVQLRNYFLGLLPSPFVLDRVPPSELQQHSV